jgi:hypothetical protein
VKPHFSVGKAACRFYPPYLRNLVVVLEIAGMTPESAAQRLVTFVMLEKAGIQGWFENATSQL